MAKAKTVRLEIGKLEFESDVPVRLWLDKVDGKIVLRGQRTGEACYWNILGINTDGSVKRDIYANGLGPPFKFDYSGRIIID